MLLLNEKRKKDRRLLSRNKRAKNRETFSKDAFLILLLHQPSLCFLGTGISVYIKDHIEKDREDDLGSGTSIIDKDRKVDNISINTLNINNIDREVNNLSISIDKLDVDKRVNNLSTSIDTTNINNLNKKANNISTSILQIDTDEE